MTGRCKAGFRPAQSPAMNDIGRGHDNTGADRTGNWRSDGPLRTAWQAERPGAAAAQRAGDGAREWHYLERAHVLSQPLGFILNGAPQASAAVTRGLRTA